MLGDARSVLAANSSTALSAPFDLIVGYPPFWPTPPHAADAEDSYLFKSRGLSGESITAEIAAAGALLLASPGGILAMVTLLFNVLPSAAHGGLQPKLDHWFFNSSIMDGASNAYRILHADVLTPEVFSEQYGPFFERDWKAYDRRRLRAIGVLDASLHGFIFAARCAQPSSRNISTIHYSHVPRLWSSIMGCLGEACCGADDCLGEEAKPRGRELRKTTGTVAMACSGDGTTPRRLPLEL